MEKGNDQVFKCDGINMTDKPTQAKVEVQSSVSELCGMTDSENRETPPEEG